MPPRERPGHRPERAPRARLAALLSAASFLAAACAGKPPPSVGLLDGALRPCPTSPNCVSSQADDAGHRVEPIPFDGSPEAALERMRRAIESLPRARVVAAEERYLHAGLESRLFGFVDDVEVVAGDEAFEIRSASRTGYSDLGVNRRRVEAIRDAFAALAP